MKFLTGYSSIISSFSSFLCFDLLLNYYCLFFIFVLLELPLFFIEPDLPELMVMWLIIVEPFANSIFTWFFSLLLILMVMYCCCWLFGYCCGWGCNCFCCENYSFCFCYYYCCFSLLLGCILITSDTILYWWQIG